MANALVIDDNRQTADSLAELLKALGLQARAAYGPGPGMSILGGDVPDVVFLDINMPGVSGFEILSYIVREPRLAKVPVFVCTSDDQPKTRELALRGGARGFLVKPVMLDGLVQSLRRIGLSVS
ncbi:MAG: hypothetical protein CO094_13465 [Anaerolineae bacterium CG_4_9_14_3_um_filter_57_17]|nr:response regulator [bacterium]NCT19793.1 response regulator [bacterium]OIO85499.1 MAG: hypothetical protein AUK01_05955 [Anaerolineae bacterium CG2_30_57_67]PJB64294.1 MAG: hypothetical protein CO094_13465 [Anaerolineae bacterium CG_4_9_14_3_um_filter_57_17]